MQRGDYWPREHKLRMNDVARFSTRPGMTIITMPNSLKFLNEKTRKVRVLEKIENICNTTRAALYRLFLFLFLLKSLPKLAPIPFEVRRYVKSLPYLAPIPFEVRQYVVCT